MAANDPSNGSIWTGVAQSFTALDAQVLAGFYVGNYSGAAISDPLLFSLYAGDGTFSNLLGQVSATVTLANNATELLLVNLASVTLTPGNSYTLVVSLPNQALPVSGDPGTFNPYGSAPYSQVSVIFNSQSNSYPAGQFYYVGSSYNESFFANWDLAFAVMPVLAVYPLQPGGDFGAVNLGSTSSTPVSMTFEFTETETLGSTAVLTQGAAGLDFTDAGTGTCAAGHAYSAGDTCTVAVNFNPVLPGTRYGAVELLDGTGNVLTTNYVQGGGVGPLVSFLPGAQKILGGGFNVPLGVAVDGSGNVYVADTAEGGVKEIPLGCGSSTCVTALGGGFYLPYGVAVDGGGNVYVVDSEADGGNGP